MKKATILIISILTLNFAYSQQNNIESIEQNQTTQEEYNYMTKGYGIQISSGLDMKNGYELDPITTIQRSYYTFTYDALLRSEKMELAGIIITAKSEVSGKTYYLGMPINNSILQADFENDIERWDGSMTTAFAQATSLLFSTISNSWIDLNKKISQENN